MKEFIDKLISRLEEYKIKRSDDSPYGIGVLNGYAEAISIVNELAEEYYANSPQKSADGWIPCSERLPEEKGKYLVTAENETGWWILENNVFVCEYAFDTFIFQGWEDNEIIAWMPLPAPYTEGE